MLEAMWRRVADLNGDNDAGQTCKAANQIIVAMTIHAVARGHGGDARPPSELQRALKEALPAERMLTDAIDRPAYANDVSARDIQLGEHQWTRGKDFDTFTPLGPWIVTGVSEEMVADLQVSCRVNGELRQQASTAQMIFTPSFLISHLAAVMTLMPGDVILTGTPGRHRTAGGGRHGGRRGRAGRIVDEFGKLIVRNLREVT